MLLTRFNKFTNAGYESCPRSNHGQWEDHAGSNTAVDTEEIRKLGMGVHITGANLYVISAPGNLCDSNWENIQSTPLDGDPRSYVCCGAFRSLVFECRSLGRRQRILTMLTCGMYCENAVVAPHCVKRTRGLKLVVEHQILLRELRRPF
jgi:hypothetical protein